MKQKSVSLGSIKYNSQKQMYHDVNVGVQKIII